MSIDEIIDTILLVAFGVVVVGALWGVVSAEHKHRRRHDDR